MGLFSRKEAGPDKPCPHCGSSIAGNAAICPSCGRDVKTGAQVMTGSGVAVASDVPLERHAVAFVPVIRGGSDEAKQCADQLNALIDNMAGQGWTFSHLEDITTLRNNGCLAGLAGNPTSLVTFQVAIFEKRP